MPGPSATYGYGVPSVYRRRMSRKRKAQMYRQLKFRTGNFSAAGSSKILVPRTKTIKTVCASQFSVTVTTCGNNSAFDITNWSIPADPLSAGTSANDFQIRGVPNNHPSEHPQLVQLGYLRARVVDALYRFDVRFTGADSAAKDFVFAYKFSPVITLTSLVHTASTVGVDNWKDMRQSRGWVWQRFSATGGGGSVYPAQGRVQVRVPDVWALITRLNTAEQTELEIEATQSTIGDNLLNAAKRCFLHVCVLSIDGTSFAANDVIIDLTLFQTVHVSRQIANDVMIDEADQGA